MKKKTIFGGIVKYVLIFLVVMGVVATFYNGDNAKDPVAINGTEFDKLVEEGKIQEAQVYAPKDTPQLRNYVLTLGNGDAFKISRSADLYPQDVEKFKEHDVVYNENFETTSGWATFLSFAGNLLFVILIFGVIMFFMNRGGMKAQQGILNNMNNQYEVLDFTSKDTKHAQLYSTSMKDVIGLPKNTRKKMDNLVRTMQRIASGQAVGDPDLTGVLLYGPPGTGKSMLAKSLAREVGAFFIYISGSDFVDRFVGQGKNNVNSLFKVARETSIKNNKKPVIIFIDEIDAIGKSREGRNASGGSDEREQTLNALLKNMDGEETEARIFVVGATNLPDTLDDALTRSGRLSERVEIPRPTKEGRKELFEYYFKKLPVGLELEDVNYDILSEYAVNMTGADIADIIEVMKQKANGEDKIRFNLNDILDIIETKMYGEVKEELMNDKDTLKSTAYHEAGHALLALKYFPQNVLKACITPRDKALGYVYHNIMDSRVSLFKKESKHYIQLTLGGYIAEKLVYDDTSSGVSNDLEQANRFASNLVRKFGTGDSLLIKPEDQFKEGLSDATMSRQELQMDTVLNECRDEAETFLTKNKHLLEKLTQMLLDKQVLNKQDLQNFYEEHQEEFMA